MTRGRGVRIEFSGEGRSVMGFLEYLVYIFVTACNISNKNLLCKMFFFEEGDRIFYPYSTLWPLSKYGLFHPKIQRLPY
jgi:hypothetical protein